MHEVEALCDRLSVFRNGRHIETFAKGERSDAEIVRLMIGRDVTAKFPPKPAARRAGADADRRPIWPGKSRLNGVSLTLGKGEIVGLGGLDGQGQKELLLALFGVLQAASRGKVRIGGKRGLAASPAAAKAGPRPHRPGPRGPQDRGADAAAVRSPTTCSPPPSTRSPAACSSTDSG